MRAFTASIEGESVQIPIPYTVSEREAGGWEDCTWASGVMLANFMYGADKVPASRVAYEDLRFAATGVREGNGQGNNLGDLERGMLRLYGFAGERIAGSWASVLARWPIGWGAAVQGLYGALPARARSSTFRGSHCMAAIRRDATSFYILDPLRANGAAPIVVTVAELGAYYSALPGAAVMVAGPGSAYWSDPMFRFDLERWAIPAGTPVFDKPVAAAAVVTRYAKAIDATTIGVPMDNSADHLDYGWRVVLVSTSALDGTLAVKAGYIKKPAQLKASDPAWDAAVLAALLDPSFRGATAGPPGDTKPLVVAAFNEGRDAVVTAATAVPRRA